MVFFQAPVISAQTFFKVFVVHTIILCAYVFTAYKILKRSRRWLNIIVSLFFIVIALGFFLNIFFVLFSFEPYQELARSIYLALMFVFLLGVFFFTIFSLILLKTETMFTKQKQLILLLIYIGFDLATFFIPIPGGGIAVGPETNWNPVWDPYYYFYVLSLFSFGSVIPQLYCFLKIYKRIEQDFLLRRWKLFIIGTILMYIMFYGTITYHLLDIQIIRVIWGYFSLFLSVGSVILIYFGFVKME